MKVLNEKYLLKAAVKGLVPETIRNRHKQPYRAPDSQSFRAGRQAAPLFEYVEALLAPSAVREGGVFDPGAVDKLLSKARQGQIASTKDNMALVGVLSTQLVIDQFIKNFPRSA
jgi:asparagine synthase (glutamine-hydrolysing)